MNEISRKFKPEEKNALAGMKADEMHSAFGDIRDQIKDGCAPEPVVDYLVEASAMTMKEFLIDTKERSTDTIQRGLFGFFMNSLTTLVSDFRSLKIAVKPTASNLLVRIVMPQKSDGNLFGSIMAAKRAANKEAHKSGVVLDVLTFEENEDNLPDGFYNIKLDAPKNALQTSA